MVYMGRLENLTGKQFGRLTVLNKAPDSKKYSQNCAYWVCQCTCGKVHTVAAQSLKNGRAKSCGCLISETTRRRTTIDLTGQRFGKLVVIRKAMQDEKPDTQDGRCGNWWICDCDCGNKNIVKKGAYLRSGRVKSCGCYNKEMSFEKNHKDITGQKFGCLTAIEAAPQLRKHRHNRSVIWRCACDCGNTAYVTVSALQGGGTISCGCVVSKNEMKIQHFLEKNNVNFRSQYSFDDLRSKETGWHLKFDFAVFDKNFKQIIFLIEYDGEQHYYGTRFSPHPEENQEKFRKIKLYDAQKDKYCQENNIELVRIPYWDAKKVEEILTDKLIEKGEMCNGI